MFELVERDGLARIGRLTTGHGAVETPALLPVLNPNRNVIPAKEMKELFGANIVITNAYIVHKSDDLREKALKDGIHSLLDFDGAIMTDSGTFQTYVYSDVEIEPLAIVRFQSQIGSDIGTILDVFSLPEASRAEIEKGVAETIRRAKESVQFKGGMALACTVQGGTFLDIRENCARTLSELDCELHPIGGVVPLLENYRFRDVVDIIVASKKGLNPSRPVHLFGAGHPLIFPLAVLLGCDLFDSAAYAKYAKDGRMIFWDGTRHIGDMKETNCFCRACSSTPIEEMKELFKAGDFRKLAEHNLYTSFGMLNELRQRVHEGRLWEFAEAHCRSHPYLLSALRALKEHKGFLEKYEPASRDTGFFYTGIESLSRPAVHRYQKRVFERYERPKTKVVVCFPEGRKPYSEHYRSEMKQILEFCDAHFVVQSFLGPVPIELDQTYPVAQSVFPDEMEPEAWEFLRRSMERFSHGLEGEFAVIWEGEETLNFLKGMVSDKATWNPDIGRVKALADVQFGKGAGEALTNGELKIVKAKTGKIRTVYLDGKHILSLRASDGLFTLKSDGGELLHGRFTPPRLRVKVDNETSEFNRDGKNVFAKFVLDCDPELRPLDEVLVVDQNDDLVAVGRALMTDNEMRAFKIGVAVQVREGKKRVMTSQS